ITRPTVLRRSALTRPVTTTLRSASRLWAMEQATSTRPRATRRFLVTPAAEATRLPAINRSITTPLDRSMSHWPVVLISPRAILILILATTRLLANQLRFALGAVAAKAIPISPVFLEQPRQAERSFTSIQTVSLAP